MGVDVGATLAKLAIRGTDGRTSFRVVPTHAIEQVAREVESTAPECVGLTGGGAVRLARLLSFDTARSEEFAAWQRGGTEMLRRQGGDPNEPFLLVSLGTGTSAMLVKGDDVTRVGGTALGGGTVIGLGAALVGTSSYAEICDLAQAGDRRRVDLLVRDIYAEGELPLPGDLNASSFAKLARPDFAGRAEPADVAHALVGMVAENVGLICSALAAALGAQRIVYGGSTLRDNQPLTDVLRVLGLAQGREVVLLENPEFVGAVGALSLALGTGQPTPLGVG